LLYIINKKIYYANRGILLNKIFTFLKKHYLKISYILIAFLLIILFYAFKLNRFFTYENAENVRNFILSFSFVGPLFIFLLYIIFNLLCLPTLFWTFISGYLYGFGYGYAIAWLGMTLGLLSSFIASRYIFREDFIKKFGTNVMIKQIEYWTNRYHFWTVLFFRVFFVFPYNMQNIAYGLTSIKIWKYLVASILGIIPTTLLYVWLGSKIALNKLNFSDLRNIMTFVGIFITCFGIIFFTSIIIRKKINFKSVEK